MNNITIGSPNTSTGNISIGYPPTSRESNCIGIGSHASDNSNNITIGSSALQAITTAIGYNALLANTTGSGPVEIGYSKIIVLTSKIISDNIVQQYCKPSTFLSKSCQW